MKLLAATRSEGKQREIRRILEPAGIEVVFPDDIGIFESPQEDILELGESFQANARAKAEYFSRKSGLPTFADDSGLEVFSLGGEPGVRSRRWSGVEGSAAQVDAANNAMLLRRLARCRARLGAGPAIAACWSTFATPTRFPRSSKGCARAGFSRRPADRKASATIRCS